jgi:hypothetical protein
MRTDKSASVQESRGAMLEWRLQVNALIDRVLGVLSATGSFAACPA